ncbi:MAG: hypothetical protein ACRDIY_14890 [Chloroflexota bacterium]
MSAIIGGTAPLRAEEHPMTVIDVPPCGCPACQQPDDHPDRELHRQMILVFSRLDEQQRRWFAALESTRLGWGGDTLPSQITGLDEKTIRRGRDELAASLAERPTDRIRLPGGGRPAAEKKIRPSSRR